MYTSRKIYVVICLFVSVLLHSTSLAHFGQEQTAPGNPQTESPKTRPSLKTPEKKSDDDSDTKQKPQEEMTVKLNTSLVNVPVIVTDRDGKYIPNLTVRNFEIYEENVKQSIDGFSSTEVPFNVVLVIDTSGSTRFKLEDIQDAALTFIEQLREKDRVMIVSFDSQVYIDSEFTNDRRQLRKAILQTRTGGATRLYDALDLVLTERLEKMNGRKAIVLFSDGVDTASRLATAPSTIDLVEESDVLVYAIQYDTKEDVRGGMFGMGRRGSAPAIIRIPPSGASDEEYRRADRYMKEVVDRSGARLYKADMLGDVKQAFQLIAEELRYQYTLSYYPLNDKRDGSYRRIRVVVDRLNSAVRARKGYRAESEPVTRETKQ
ncbi:MAG: VWA domain-containing protein [Acidobacteria bacterium]|nr:VWA domain-containing protein [Acidobacteriota bacterium]